MISEHFTKKEITCKCGCGQSTIQYELYRVMEIVREYCGGHAVNVHCVNRCKKHNRTIYEKLIAQGKETKVRESQHQIGGGMDFHIPKLKMKRLHTIMLDLFDQGVVNDLGLYDWGCHVGTRTGKKRFWDKRT